VISPTFGSSLLTSSHLLLCFSIPLTMPPRKQPPQQDPEEEDGDLVIGQQFKEMMHMMESLTASMNETFNKTTTSMNEMLHKSQASTKTTLERMQCAIAATADCDRTTSKMRGFVSQDHIGGFSTKRECANTHK
jgi:hypothetical protein